MVDNSLRDIILRKRIVLLDKDTYKDFRTLYLQEDDPTEYSFVTKHIGSLEIWDVLCTTQWFKPIVAQWRRELDLKIKSKALRALRIVASGDTRDAFVANRYLLDGNWKETKTKRGRPSKQEVLDEANRMASDIQKTEEDWNRIFK